MNSSKNMVSEQGFVTFAATHKSNALHTKLAVSWAQEIKPLTRPALLSEPPPSDNITAMLHPLTKECKTWPSSVSFPFPAKLCHRNTNVAHLERFGFVILLLYFYFLKPFVTSEGIDPLNLNSTSWSRTCHMFSCVNIIYCVQTWQIGNAKVWFYYL